MSTSSSSSSGKKRKKENYKLQEKENFDPGSAGQDNKVKATKSKGYSILEKLTKKTEKPKEADQEPSKEVPPQTKYQPLPDGPYPRRRGRKSAAQKFSLSSDSETGETIVTIHFTKKGMKEAPDDIAEPEYDAAAEEDNNEENVDEVDEVPEEYVPTEEICKNNVLLEHCDICDWMMNQTN